MSIYRLSIHPYQLRFKQPAGTSRGVYQVRNVWYVLLTSGEHPGRVGVGECAPLPDLSCDALPDYERILSDVCRQVERDGCIDQEALRPYPSILFGLETAFRHFEVGGYSLWDTPFSRSEAGIPINGLIWMNDYANMLSQIETKLAAGFRCVKLKIGAIRFEEELALLKHIRNRYTADDIELRVDANGAFPPEEALDKLRRLAALKIHSIEQPIRAGQWDEMARLTAEPPLPIALDEELTGVFLLDEKKRLLDTIRPQYIILKPSLHGGIAGCMEWIQEAEQRHIGWWITSTLESNIGLNAIAQWCGTLTNPLPQGLGTGQLFTNNIDLPLAIHRDCLYYEPATRKDETITIEGVCYTKDTLPLFMEHTDTPINQELYTFLQDWFNDSPFICVQTSGSTGSPKQLVVRKEQMRASARQTCTFMGLQPGDTALLCMPLAYIAGKMMVVRALTNRLNLLVREPSGHPLADVTVPLRFASMIPMQVIQSLEVPEEAERLRQTDILLIGGGFVDPSLEKELSLFPHTVYASYGMTETLSHIALRQLNGADASPAYTPLPAVMLSLSDEGTLVIDAPLVADDRLVTNDMAEFLPDGRFLITGRKDNVINSGGIKMQIECIEDILRTFISATFAITSVPDVLLGEAVVLLVGGQVDIPLLWKQVRKTLPKYQQPKQIIPVDTIPLTGSGKTDRTACKRLAVEQTKTHH